MVEANARLGAGLAYGTDDPAHRTNVAEARMSLFDEDPQRFDAWMKAAPATRSDPAAPAANGNAFVSRNIFGRYVDEELAAAVAAAPRQALRHIQDRAVHAEPCGAGFRIRLAKGDPVAADTIVLATGRPPPALPTPLARVSGSSHQVIGNPWLPGALEAVGDDDTVLIIGSDLSMCDVVASLHRQGHRAPVAVVSRHGLLPRPRTMSPVAAFGDFTTHPECTATGLLRRVRRAVGQAAQSGRPWEDVAAALRDQAWIVWGTLAWPERQGLVRAAARRCGTRCLPRWRQRD